MKKCVLFCEKKKDMKREGGGHLKIISLRTIK